MATLDVYVESDGARAALRLKGEFDMGGELVFERKLDTLLRGSPTTVLFDLRSLKFLDSTGLRALLRARERGQREGWELALTRAPRAVERVFELTGTQGIFRIVDDPAGSAADGAPKLGREAPHISDLLKSQVKPPRFSRRS